MMKSVFLAFFYCCLLYGQNPPIAIRIDNISSSDSIGERKFKIDYHIENLTEKEVSFYLDPEGFIPNSRASMSRAVFYKIYQNQEVIDLESIFVNKKARKFSMLLEKAQTQEEKNALIKKFLKEEMNMDMDSTMAESKKDTAYIWRKTDKHVLDDLFRLKPHEKKFFSKVMVWDKKRYYKIDDIEYYIDEKIPHYFEISINLMKEEFRKVVSSETFTKIIADPTLIKGWYTSNRAEINFKE